MVVASGQVVAEPQAPWMPYAGPLVSIAPIPGSGVEATGAWHSARSLVIVAAHRPKPLRPKPVPRPAPRRIVLKSGGVRGVATWFCLPGVSRCTAGYSPGGAYGAAGPALRVALGGNAGSRCPCPWRGKVVYVNGVPITLVDWCACGSNHVIDVFHATWLTIPHPDRVVIRWP